VGLDASSHPAHALPDARRVRIGRRRARRASSFHRRGGRHRPARQVTAAYRRILSQAASLYAQKRDHVERLRREQTVIDTPDDRLDLALEWAKVNLDEQMVCNPDLGCGLVAGWGPSGQSTRPGFGWFFGGDAAINSLAMSATGMTDEVAHGLRFLAKSSAPTGRSRTRSRNRPAGCRGSPTFRTPTITPTRRRTTWSRSGATGARRATRRSCASCGR
jgi:hypothetical protein